MKKSRVVYKREIDDLIEIRVLFLIFLFTNLINFHFQNKSFLFKFALQFIINKYQSSNHTNIIILFIMIKKINGYRIFMNKKLGKGAYGIVFIHL